MSEVHQLVGVPITCHAFNKDRTELAICPNSNEVHIYKKSGNTWNFTHILDEHDKLVTSLDWAPNTNRIVSCSQDRNAYVWNLENGEWKPTLVILRINRAATVVKWSPKEDKFAVASGARCISVCYFEKENDWWVSKHIKKPIRSTVLSIDWHKNNILISAGASDFKARVFSGYIKGIDEKPDSACSWGDKFPFGECLAEFPSGGWVHDVAFSPDGETIAWVSHDSAFNVVTGISGKVQTIKLKTLPYTHLLWTSPKSIVAVGHDANPALFTSDGANWKFAEQLDTGGKAENKAGGNAAMNKFKQMDSRAQEGEGDINLKTVHQNSISGIGIFGGNKDNVSKYSTVGIDGKLVIWDRK